MSPDGQSSKPTDEAVFAKALLNPHAPVPPAVARANGGDPQEAFNVYRNNVMASLVDALADTFPITVQLLGEEPSRALMAAICAPIAAAFAGSGDKWRGLPRLSRRHPIATQRPFLADVARLERLLTRRLSRCRCARS